MREEKLIKAMMSGDTFLGFRFDNAYASFMFGSRELTREELEAHFPRYKFGFMKQVHGHAVVEAQADVTPDADAQFTHAKNFALVAQSADCTPILLANENTVCAVHSGWRGTAQDIAGATAAAFREAPPKVAVIGPHILRASFEVGLDVAAQLREASPDPDNGIWYPHVDARKAYIDLTEIVRRQLRRAFGSSLEIHECLEDTMTSPRFHSFRRGKQPSERNFSFVVLKE